MAKNGKWVALLGLLALSALFFLIHLPISGDYSHAPKLLSHGMDALICHGEQLFSPVIELFAGSEARLALCQRPRPSEPHKTRPALYVFGDSFSDSGNSNYLQTLITVDYAPYGIDFPFGATGRFTNGKTYVDFLAEYLELPYPPPYLGLSARDRKYVTLGVNYATGAAGILEESGKFWGDKMHLQEQISCFQDTEMNDLIWIYNPFELRSYLSKSIFAISIGSNDYLHNYLQPAYYNSSLQYNPEQFADILVDEIQKGLRKLYALGARKFLVYNIGRIGCLPAIVNAYGGNRTTPCVEDVNNLVAIYNSKLSSMINILEFQLRGSTFVRGDAGFADPPSVYNGTLVTKIPCCGVNANGLCLPDQPPCQNRSAYRFWDAFHSTEDTYRRIAEDCFRGSQSCTPINVKQLARK